MKTPLSYRLSEARDDALKAEADLHDAGNLLDMALYHLRRTYHSDYCPRGRDDYDCTCGLSGLKDEIEEWLKRD